MKKFLEENEENLVSIITILFIVLSVFIIIILWVNTIGDITNKAINQLTEVDYDNNMKNEYQNILSTLLNTNHIDELYKKLEIEYISKNNINEDNIREFLLKNNLIGNSIYFISSDVIDNINGTKIFRFYYKNYSNYKYVNVIEINPNEYYISFEQENIVDYINFVTSGVYEGIRYEIAPLETTSNSIKYELKITNENELDANIDFNDVNAIQLVTSSGNISLGGVIAENNKNITKGSTISRELYYNIDENSISNIIGITIYNVKVGEKSFNLEIYF